MQQPVFLSASIPYREPYVENSDPIAIREAVLALVAVTVRSNQLVFGGHPAISPMVEHAARSLDAVGNVYIYQSRWFEERIPPEARAFQNFTFTDIGADEPDSLRIMREIMIGSWNFGAAFFIGGMEGVIDEYEMFVNMHPERPVFPIASTGSAARELWEKNVGPGDKETRDQLVYDNEYRALFRKLLNQSEEK